jgi:uncharacterized coiled-coil DUF342 family protein
MSWHGRFRFGIKPEQLAKNQEHTKELEAEGRRLDGSKPMKTWKELHEENITLLKKVENLEDELFETVGKYTDMRHEADELRTQLEELRTEYDKARTALRCFAKVIGNDIEDPAKAKRREYNKRYYEAHREEIRKRQNAYHRGYLKRKREERENASRMQ